MNHREENDAGRPEPGHATDEPPVMHSFCNSEEREDVCMTDSRTSPRLSVLDAPAEWRYLGPHRAYGATTRRVASTWPLPSRDRGGGLFAHEREMSGAHADPAGGRRVRTREHVDLVAKGDDAPSAEWDGRTTDGCYIRQVHGSRPPDDQGKHFSQIPCEPARSP